MKNIKFLFFSLSLAVLVFFSSCSDDSTTVTNVSPTVASALSDLTLSEGFATETIDFSSVFTDTNGDNLTYSAASSNTSVATTSISGTTLTITEVGSGTTTITLTAEDAEFSVDDEFEVTIGCTNDNSLQSTANSCSETGEVNTYTASVSGDIRTITTNGLPNHIYTNSLREGGELNDDEKVYTVDATPTQNSTPTSTLDETGRPGQSFGVALNGVIISPAPGEPFIFEDASTGEYNWDWVFEPVNNMHEVVLDCSMAHVQPDGTYHYHGDMAPLADLLLSGLGTGGTVPTEPVQIGWAADGFPIMYKYGYDSNNNLVEMQSSYQIKSGDRPGDGITEPCGEYNGKYTNDYEYVSGAGHLDECNGISQSITIGAETFSYYYVITSEFPIVPRYFRGTPDASF